MPTGDASEPTTPVPMTRADRDAISYASETILDAANGDHVSHGEASRRVEPLSRVLAAYDAAVARPAEPERKKGMLDTVIDALATGGASLLRPAEPERTVRWCDAHSPGYGTGGQPADLCPFRHSSARECRVSTRLVGGEAT